MVTAGRPDGEGHQVSRDPRAGDGGTPHPGAIDGPRSGYGGHPAGAYGGLSGHYPHLRINTRKRLDLDEIITVRGFARPSWGSGLLLVIGLPRGRTSDASR
jgi:hypothetical protein